MARPINLFQGPAPQAMAMMGQGLSEAGARIGQFQQQGMQALGQGLAEGLQGAASAVKDIKTAQAANNVTKSIFSDRTMFKMFFPEGTEEQREKMLSSFNDTIKSNGQMGGLQFTSQIMGPFLEQQRLGQQFQQQMKLAQAKMQKSPDYSPVISALDKEIASIENVDAPLPYQPKESGVNSLPLIEPQQGQSGMNMADMLGKFLTKKYGKPVGKPSNQDILEFERFLQSGGE